LALHWQPRDDDPVSEFTPEPVSSSTPAAGPAAPIASPGGIAWQATILDGMLLATAGAVSGALLAVLFWMLR
jgi:hypothetical protein